MSESVITALVAVGLVAALVALSLNWRTHNQIRRLFSETGHEEFGEVLLAHQRQLRRNLETQKDIKSRLEHLERESHFLLNQVGLVKYNPFPNSGGNMSFSLALINDNGDGAVVTSLHSREGTRIYSKVVKNYDSDQHLTEEEKQAISQARRTNS